MCFSWRSIYNWLDFHSENELREVLRICCKYALVISRFRTSIWWSLSLHRAFCILFNCTHRQMHIYIYIYMLLFNKSKIYIKTLKTLLHVSIIRSFSGSIHCSLLNSHAIRHTTHVHSQAHSEQRTTHTQHKTCCHSTKLT